MQSRSRSRLSQLPPIPRQGMRSPSPVRSVADNTQDCIEGFKQLIAKIPNDYICASNIILALARALKHQINDHQLVGSSRVLAVVARDFYLEAISLGNHSAAREWNTLQKEKIFASLPSRQEPAYECEKAKKPTFAELNAFLVKQFKEMVFQLKHLMPLDMSTIVASLFYTVGMAIYNGQLLGRGEVNALFQIAPTHPAHRHYTRITDALLIIAAAAQLGHAKAAEWLHSYKPALRALDIQLPPIPKTSMPDSEQRESSGVLRIRRLDSFDMRQQETTTKLPVINEDPYQIPDTPRQVHFEPRRRWF